MVYPLTHQMQPTFNSCMSACLAMLLDRPVEEVVASYHDLMAGWEMTMGDILSIEGIPHMMGKGINQTPTIFHDYVYVLCMPSLTCQGLLHQVLLDTRNEQTVMYDPLKGTGKPYYTFDESDKSPIAVKPVSWVVDYVVDPLEIGVYRG